MIRINIKKDGKITVKAFISKIDLTGYVLDFIGGGETQKTADKIWELNVGTSIIHNGYTIAMAGKSRAGNVMYGGQ